MLRHLSSLPLSLGGASSSGLPGLRGVLLRAGVFVLAYLLFLGAGVLSARMEGLLVDGAQRAGLHVVLTKARPLPLPGLRAERLRVFGPQGGKPLLDLADATVRLSFTALATGRLGLDVAGSCGKGGTLELAASTGFLFDTQRARVRLGLDAVPLEALNAADVLGGTLEGTATGSVRFAGAPTEALAGSGSVDLHLDGLDIDNPVPLMKDKRLKGLTLTVRGDMQDGRAVLDTLRVQGKDLDVQGRGRIALNAAEPLASTLDLDGSVRVPAGRMVTALLHKDDVARLERGDAVEFRLTGRLDDPKFQRR